jgi:hypothetical protein
MPENIKVEFVNRENELKDLCSSSALRNVVEAPAGYGKTHLLKAVKGKFLEEDPNFDSTQNIQKGCALIDLQKYRGEHSVIGIIHEIAKQIGNKRIRASEFLPAYDELSGHLGNYSAILLLFDSVDRSNDEALGKLYRDLLEDGLFRALYPKLKIVFAGRYVRYIKSNTDMWAKRSFPRWDGYIFTELRPFTAPIVEEFLRQRYKNTKGEPHQEGKDRFENWSNGIMDLSGGHPGAITKLADFLSDTKRGNWVADFNNKNQKLRRYEEFVKEEVDQVLNDINDEVARDDLIKLSVFRIFNLDTIAFLKSIGELDKKRDDYIIFAPLAKTGLVKRHPDSVFYSDSIIRNLVLSKLKNETPAEHEKLNNEALRFYNLRIELAIADHERAKERAQQAGAPLYISVYTREAIYHLSQMPGLSRNTLVTELSKYADNFRKVGLAVSDKDCREQIEAVIWDDSDIVTAIGKDGIGPLLDQLFHVSASVQESSPAPPAQKKLPARRRPGLKGASSQQLKVLLLAANPKKTGRIQLDEEIRSIETKIRWGGHKEVINIIPAVAVRSDEVISLLNEHNPDVVHFSGHGSLDGEILLVDKSGTKSKAVGAVAIRKIFAAARDNVRLVVLNACYTQQIAEALVNVIDLAVGTDKSIGDDDAIAFAAAFYSALGYGLSVQQAFEQGKAAITVEAPDHEDVFNLRCRTGIDPSEVFLLNPK